MKVIYINLLLIFISINGFAQTNKVAILDFENTSGKVEYDALGKAMSSMLITDLSNNIHPKKVEFFERSQLNKLLDEQKLQKSKNFDAKTAVDFGKLSGVNYVFVGSIFVMDGNCSITSNLVDVQTSKIILSKEANGKIETWLQLKSQLAEAIAQQLNNPITLDPSYKDLITTLATLNQYGKILTTMDQGDAEKAEQMRSLFEETNPDFKYFIEIKDEIERLKQRVSELENVTEILTDNFDLGEKAEKKKDFKSAIKYFEKFINNSGDQGFVENKKLYAYSKLAKCQFLIEDYANSLVNSRNAQLIYPYYPEANEIELMTIIQLNLSDEIEHKYSFILDSLTFRNEQNFRRQEKNSLLKWESIDGIYFGLLPAGDVDQNDSGTWLYLGLRDYGYGSSAENSLRLSKALKFYSIKIPKYKDKLHSYEKIENKLISFNDNIIFNHEYMLNFYELSLDFADELFNSKQYDKYKIHLSKEIRRIEGFGIPCESCYPVPRKPLDYFKSPDIDKFITSVGLENTSEDFFKKFHFLYGEFIFRKLIFSLQENNIKDAANLYRTILINGVVSDRENYFYGRYWDIILKLRVITEDYNSRSPLSLKELEVRLDDRIRKSLKDNGLNQDLLKKLKAEKIEFKTGNTVIEIDTTKNDGKLIWSKNIGLIEDSKGNKILYCNIDSLEEFNRKKIPAYTFYDGDIRNGEKYGKLYNFSAIELLIQNPPIGWRVAKIDDFIYDQILKDYFFDCYEAQQEYLKKYPDVKDYTLGPIRHYEFFGKKEGRTWNSKICANDLINNCQIRGLYGFNPSGKCENGGYFSIDGTAGFWTADKLENSENFQMIEFRKGSCLAISRGYNGYYSILMVRTE
jgi:TolB-like protein